MKKIILSMVTVCIAVAASAQISYNVKGGLGAGSFYSMADEYSSDVRFSWRFGAGMEYAFNNAWAITPSLLFVHTGSTATALGVQFDDEFQVDKTVTNKYVANLNYLQLPIDVQWRTAISDNLSLSIFLGPYIAIGVGGKTKNEYTVNDVRAAGDNISHAEQVSSFKDEEEGGAGFKRFDFGLNYGANFEMNKFTVGVNIDLGLIRNQSTLKSKRMDANVVVGYRF